MVPDGCGGEETMTLYYDHAGITIYHGDCREILPELELVDLVVTSPPYGEQRDYESGFTDWDAVVPPAIASVRHHKATQWLVNLGMFTRGGSVVTYWDALTARMIQHGYQLAGWYVWDKGYGYPMQSRGELHRSHEWIFHFREEAVEPVKWIQTNGGTIHGSGGRNKDGSHKGVGDRIGRLVNAERTHTSVFSCQPDKSMSTGHPARMPIKLASDIRFHPAFRLDHLLLAEVPSCRPQGIKRDAGLETRLLGRDNEAKSTFFLTAVLLLRGMEPLGPGPNATPNRILPQISGKPTEVPDHSMFVIQITGRDLDDVVAVVPEPTADFPILLLGVRIAMDVFA